MDKSLMAGSTTLLVLALLREGDQYGYQMISRLAERSDQTFQLREGTLYPILHGLEREKCVTSYLKQADTGRERKYYHITPKGLERLEEKTQEWMMFTQKVNGVTFGTAPGLV